MASIRKALQVRVDRKVVPDDSGNRREEVVSIEPDWRQVRSLCEEALAKSRHLEVCVDYAAALVELEGLVGAAAGIELIEELLQHYWEPLFPSLDKSDDHDPSQRIGLIENLGSTPAPLAEDPVGFVRRLSRAPLCKSRGGTVTLADFKDGRTPAPGTPEAVPVQGAFAAMCAESGGAEALAANQVAIELAVNSLDRIKDFLAGVPGGRAPDFDLLLDTLKRQRRILDVFAGENSGSLPNATIAETIDGKTNAPGTSIHGAGSILPSAAGSGEIAGSADVIRLLDKICAYYAAAEPSSPVPLLLQRAKRLVGRSFLEVIGDLSSGSMDDIRKITGEPPVNQ
jgi:type VI secretion system protein ImpA